MREGCATEGRIHASATAAPKRASARPTAPARRYAMAQASSPLGNDPMHSLWRDGTAGGCRYAFGGPGGLKGTTATPLPAPASKRRVTRKPNASAIDTAT